MKARSILQLLGTLLGIVCSSSHLHAERYMIIGDSLSREYQFEFTTFDEARNWVEILAAVRPDDFDFGRVRTIDLGFIDSSWDITSHAYNWALPTYSAEQYNELLSSSGILQQLFQGLIDSAYDDTERAFIFVGGNDIDRIYNDIYQGRDPDNDGVKAIYSDIKDILEEVQRQNSDLDIVIVNVPHVGATPEIKSAHPTDSVKTQRVSDALELLNRQLRKLADENDAAYVDVYTLTHDLIEPETYCIGGVSFINDGDDDGDPNYMWLGGSLAANFHPNTNGQALIAQAIITGINERFGNRIAPLTETEILEDVLGLSASMPYAQWAEGYQLPTGLAGQADDPDLDGVANLMECALGLHPLKPDASRLISRTVETTAEGTFFTLRYQPRVADCPFISVIPQQSHDLKNWTDIPFSAISISSDRTVTVRLELDGLTYIRLLAVEQ